ncbi:MAG: hypothetical protein QM811_15340 [Pirellulales bacterium]
MHAKLRFLAGIVLGLTLVGCGPSAEERRAEYDAKFQALQQRLLTAEQQASEQDRQTQARIRTLPLEQAKQAHIDAMDARMKPMRDFGAEVERLNQEYADVRGPKAK